MRVKGLDEMLPDKDVTTDPDTGLITTDCVHLNPMYEQLTPKKMRKDLNALLRDENNAKLLLSMENMKLVEKAKSIINYALGTDINVPDMGLIMERKAVSLSESARRLESAIGLLWDRTVNMDEYYQKVLAEIEEAYLRTRFGVKGMEKERRKIHEINTKLKSTPKGNQKRLEMTKEKRAAMMRYFSNLELAVTAGVQYNVRSSERRILDIYTEFSAVSHARALALVKYAEILSEHMTEISFVYGMMPETIKKEMKLEDSLNRSKHALMKYTMIFSRFHEKSFERMKALIQNNAIQITGSETEYDSSPVEAAELVKQKMEAV